MHTNTPIPASIAKLRHSEKRRPVFITDTITKHNVRPVFNTEMSSRTALAQSFIKKSACISIGFLNA
jgi:hypothetical protein